MIRNSTCEALHGCDRTDLTLTFVTTWFHRAPVGDGGQEQACCAFLTFEVQELPDECG